MAVQEAGLQVSMSRGYSNNRLEVVDSRLRGNDRT